MWTFLPTKPILLIEVGSKNETQILIVYVLGTLIWNQLPESYAMIKLTLANNNNKNTFFYRKISR